MSTTNIEKFNEIVGIIFGKLYESFPLKIDLLSIEVIGEPLQYSDGIYSDELCTTVEDHRFFLDTVDWLMTNGYLAGTMSSASCHRAVLTAEGLEVLKAIPDSLETPLGDRIKETLKTESKEALRSLVSQTLGIGLQFVSRSIGLG